MADQENPLNDEQFSDLSVTANTDRDEAAGAEWVAPRPPGAAGRQQARPTQNGHRPGSNGFAPANLAPDILPGAATADRQHARRGWIPLVLGLIGLVAVFACLGAVAFLALNALSLQSSLDSPQQTISTFYTALHNRDYQNAYSQLSSRYQHELGFSSFQAEYVTQDDLVGPIESQQITNIQTQSDSATAVVQLVRGTQAATQINQTHRLTLVRESGAWKIDHLAAGQTSP